MTTDTDTDTIQKRIRRQTDPVYRARYNAMRKAYADRKKADPDYHAMVKAKNARYWEMHKDEINASRRRRKPSSPMSR